MDNKASDPKTLTFSKKEFIPTKDKTVWKIRLGLTVLFSLFLLVAIIFAVFGLFQFLNSGAYYLFIAGGICIIFSIFTQIARKIILNIVKKHAFSTLKAYFEQHKTDNLFVLQDPNRAFALEDKENGTLEIHQDVQKLFSIKISNIKEIISIPNPALQNRYLKKAMIHGIPPYSTIIVKSMDESFFQIDLTNFFTTQKMFSRNLSPREMKTLYEENVKKLDSFIQFYSLPIPVKI